MLAEQYPAQSRRRVERDHCQEACCRITALDVAYWFAKLAVWPPRLCPLAALRRIIWPVDDPPKSGVKKPGVNRASCHTSCEYANNTDLETPVKRLIEARPSTAAC